jgi:hypothetical protein
MDSSFVDAASGAAAGGVPAPAGGACANADAAAANVSSVDTATAFQSLVIRLLLLRNFGFRNFFEGLCADSPNFLENTPERTPVAATPLVRDAKILKMFHLREEL